MSHLHARMACFDPRPREGGDRRGRRESRSDCSFDPRPREGGDCRGIPTLRRSIRFRSTPPRRGRQAPSTRPSARRGVSIHAPAKGATRCAVGVDRDADVSIHAPAKGATRLGAMRTTCQTFRSTPPRRGRRGQLVSRSAIDVSIHAPAKGATGRREPASRLDGFDPRPREGGDAAASHRHERCRGFDPRPREGGDAHDAAACTIGMHVSIHAPAKGATATATRCDARAARFRSTPPRRGRRRDAGAS